ncbi:hypothetical protein K438DRAFT_1981420 [Mycena galopus ATCC 62051]|nr:hypothetical protein K438DRAFT_1981420 [Mycena galopus ATCC 62051]
MILSSILFNPTLRVYNLRLLLVANLVIIAFAGRQLQIDRHQVYPLVGGVTDLAADILQILAVIVICIHHDLASIMSLPFKWTARGLALIDLAAVVVEIGVLISIYVWLLNVTYENTPLVVSLISLCLSLLFRTATVFATEAKVLTQRLPFLGSCTPSLPPYNYLSILLNQSLERPLGESKYIIFARAVVLSCNGIALPAFGIYATIIRPASAVISTIVIPNAEEIPWASTDSGSSQFTVNAGSNSNTINCNSWVDAIYVCPVRWVDIERIHVSIVFPSKAGTDITILCPECEEWTFHIVPGSQLFGVLTWSQRQTILQRELSVPPIIFSPEVYALQQNLSSPPGANISSLTLLQSSPFPTKFLQDTVDASVLSGIASFGGFWTFINGAFTFFFGANIIYFAFGKRPLSALGVVQWFQRRALVRTWHEDFPAIYIEGGLDEGQQNPRDSYDDITDASRQTPSYRPLGYKLDEIPLLDVDISHGNAP